MSEQAATPGAGAPTTTPGPAPAGPDERSPRLRRGSVQVEAPTLDADQRRVVEHRDGPLLVLAGPGTGKTTTLVEAVVARLQADEGQSAGSGRTPLVLTFSRRAAAELRARITARLGRSTATPLAMTFHSFCFALLRRFADDESGEEVRLLTGPEQEFRVREVLAGRYERDPQLQGWPASLRAAFPTRGFAQEVRAVIARARQLGLDPEDLVAAGAATERPQWQAVGEFMEEYLEVLDFEGVLDYSELVHRCRILLTDPQILSTVRAELDGIFLDEFQDTDPAQVALVAQLTAPGDTVVAVGDPDQSIFGFRGARARGILDFPDTFRDRDRRPAEVVALGATRRFGSQIARATRRIANRLPLARSLEPSLRQRFRDPEVDPSLPPGRVEVLQTESLGAQAEHIADILRQAHLHRDVPWSQMAVLVRSGRRDLPPLVRALAAAGVPVEVAGDEIALAAELAVRPLLLGLQVALQPTGPDTDQTTRLLLSPLGGLDSLGVRRLGRMLRHAEHLQLAGAGLPESSAELMRLALGDPSRIDDCEQLLGAAPELERVRSLARLLSEARALIDSSASAEEVLWLLWSSTSWPHRLRNEALQGGDSGRRADRDLDAVCALFDIAARSEEVVGQRGVLGFLAEVEAQQIPGDNQREDEAPGRGVRLLTAHRAKGLQWRLVVVAGVQEGGWPDLRARGTLLQADELGTDPGAQTGPGPEAIGSRLAEERRLFYVACTRAREHLVVTAVSGTEGEGDQPSRFLSELGVPVREVSGRPRRPLNLSALVGELRRVSADPEQPPALREAAAVRLARLADARGDQGEALAPAADPDSWWGMRTPTAAPGPLTVEGEPVRLSGSSLADLLRCPRRWFLARQANAEAGRRSQQSTGDLVHVLVDHAARQGVPADELAEHLDEVWDQIGFPANYLSGVERIQAEEMLGRQAAWVRANDTRELLGTEVPFTVDVDTSAGPVRLRGAVDRLERTPDGRLMVVDFKTGRHLPTQRELAEHEQLGVYQLAATEGAFEEYAPGERRVAGAELVQLRHGEGQLDYPKVFRQDSLDTRPHLGPEDEDATTWVHARLGRAAQVVRSEQFVAQVCDVCRYCAFADSCPARGSQVVQ